LTEEQLDNTSGGQKITADIYVGGGKYKTMTFEAQVQEMKMPLFCPIQQIRLLKPA